MLLLVAGRARIRRSASQRHGHFSACQIVFVPSDVTGLIRFRQHVAAEVARSARRRAVRIRRLRQSVQHVMHVVRHVPVGIGIGKLIAV